MCVCAQRPKTHVFISIVYLYLNASFTFKKWLVVLGMLLCHFGSALKLVLKSVGEQLWRETVMGLEQLLD